MRVKYMDRVQGEASAAGSVPRGITAGSQHQCGARGINLAALPKAPSRQGSQEEVSFPFFEAMYVVPPVWGFAIKLRHTRS